jgi:hypothetical protein
MIKLHDTYDERSTKIMMSKPITELSRYIGQKWFLPLEKLSERSGVAMTVIIKAVHGEKIRSDNERKIREVLDRL